MRRVLYYSCFGAEKTEPGKWKVSNSESQDQHVGDTKLNPGSFRSTANFNPGLLMMLF